MKLDFQIESAKAAPAVAGTVLSAVTLNGVVALVTLFYVLLQILYLIWKWQREAAHPPKSSRKRADDGI